MSNYQFTHTFQSAYSLLSLFFLLNTEAIIAQVWQYGLKSGLTIGAVIGPKSEEASGQALYSIGGGLFIGQTFSNKLGWRVDINYVRTGIFYQQSVAKTDTIYSQTIGPSVLDIPTFYTADVAGSFKLHYLTLPIQMTWAIREEWQLKLGLNTGLLLQGTHTGTAITDIGTFAGDREQFATEADYEAALFIYRQASDYDESYAINTFDGGALIGLEWQPIAFASMFIDTQFSVSYLQQATPQIPVQFRNLYINTGICIYFNKTSRL